MKRIHLFIFLAFIFSLTANLFAQETFDVRLKSAQKLIKEEKWAEAQKEARTLISDADTESQKKEVFKILSDTRFHLLFSKKQTDTSERYEVKSGDTLGRIAAKKNVTVELLRKANKIKKDVVWVGMKLKVEKTPFTLEVTVHNNTLWLKQGEHYVKKYSVSTGEKGNTPVGKYKIANKVIDPTWYHEDEVILPGDPKNGLGSRWMGFDLKGYGIHGTIEPGKIGQPASLGCVRMHNRDVEEVFDIIPVGTQVIIKK